jgi:hypothetical protein
LKKKKSRADWTGHEVNPASREWKEPRHALVVDPFWDATIAQILSIHSWKVYSSVFLLFWIFLFQNDDMVEDLFKRKKSSGPQILFLARVL